MCVPHTPTHLPVGNEIEQQVAFEVQNYEYVDPTFETNISIFLLI